MTQQQTWRQRREAQGLRVILDSRTLEEAAQRLGLSVSWVKRILARNS